LLGDWTSALAGSKLDLSGYVLSFEDNFDAMTVVPNTGDGDWYAPVRPTYGAATFVGPTAAVNPFSVSDGALTIRMEQVDGRWQSGHMQTVNGANQGFSQQYGYFEMRAKFEGGAGAWPSFWLLPADSTKPRVEIDVIEAYGSDGDGHHAAVHFTPTEVSDLKEKVANSEYTDLSGSMFDGQFHTYGALVSPDWIAIYHDGVEVTRFPSNQYLNVPLYMNVSLAMNSSEVGKAAGAYSMTVDYVRAYADPDVAATALKDADPQSAGAGPKVVYGTAGDDIYRVTGSRDQIVELAGGGVDTVVSAGNIILSENVENGRLEGSSGAALLGNALSNLLSGGDGADTLDGGAGADTLRGGPGSDTYYVDDVGDVISDDSEIGLDLVISRVSYSLAGSSKKLENLTLIGSGDINATGNDLANYLTGNSGANILSGAGRDDTMAGGAGDDTYIVSDMADKVIENDREGVDTVISSQTFSLGKLLYVENLTLSGKGALNATGNGLDNVLTGNAGANVIDGKLGADTIAGGGGADTLTGGAGADHFVFDAALADAGVDVIKDFNVAEDTIAFDHDVFGALGGPGALAAGAFRVGAGATDADDRIIYNSGTGELFYDADGAGAAWTQVKVAQLSGGLSMTDQDFLVV
jgi:Ca2+-binding RTX toxin-like protein